MKISPISPTAPERKSDPARDTFDLRPALFARYGVLDELRYDYPLVLVDDTDDGPLLRPLCRVIDDILKAVAPADVSGEAQRQQVLTLEADIRKGVSRGREGRLSDLWRDCAAEFLKRTGEVPFGPLDTNLENARKRLAVDGLVIGCDEKTPGKVLRHAWNAKQRAKARKFRNIVDGLILRLTDIQKSDHMKSDEAHGPDALASSMGATAEGSIDFGALSAVLARARPEDRLPDDRVKRLRNVMRVLKNQPFFGPGRASHSSPGRRDPYSYTFDNCTAALDAYRDRLPDVLEFTKALTIAELEVENKYRPELHDPIFERFDESDLSAEQIGLLPSALVCLRDGETESAEVARTYEALACGLPITVLIQIDDLLGPTSPEPPQNSFGSGTARLAAMAMGLNNAFVLQSSSAHLYRMRDALLRGMRYSGPALISIYSGAATTASEMSPYVLSAAATESRAFPNFTYDPSAGRDWAERFDLSNNPQVGSDWPVHTLEFESELGERKAETVPFTFADFAICDRRYRRFCHTTEVAEWTDDMMSVSDWLKLPQDDDSPRVPFVPALDEEQRMFHTIVDGKIAGAARRCHDAWCRLQELAGINNSHTVRALESERLQRETTAQTAIPTAAPAKGSGENVTGDPEQPAGNVVPQEAASTTEDQIADGVPWIETARCTTCNECVQINSKLFAYNENMQAYVADPDGGTYRQLVEAAEGCQVSIIHPGRPRDLQEPNLDELVQRAEPFG